MTLNSVMLVLLRFLVFYFISIGIIFILSYLLLDRKKNDLKNIKGIKKVVFGLLMGLNDFNILAISVSLLKFMFIIWTVFDSTSICIIHIVFLVSLAILFGIFTKSIKYTIFELISSIAIYYSLFSSRLLTNYLVEVRYEWYVYFGDILLKIFIVLYSTLFLLKNINTSVLKTKYVRRDRHEDI